MNMDLKMNRRLPVVTNRLGVALLLALFPLCLKFGPLKLSLAVGAFGLTLALASRWWASHMPVLLQMTPTGVCFTASPWQPSLFKGQRLPWADIATVEVVTPPAKVQPAPSYVCLQLKPGARPPGKATNPSPWQWLAGQAFSQAEASVFRAAGKKFDIVLTPMLEMPMATLADLIRSQLAACQPSLQATPPQLVNA
jgi:hypothetical protein